ncbi:MAG: abortive phage infection protein [Chitinophagaceae bacterium]|nr:MAG: abortive phage infection protein [Chitinophagaceae bacterium]
MELNEFLLQTQTDVKAEIGERLTVADGASLYHESVFSEIVMQHMADIGMTFPDYQICHYTAKLKNANLRLSGYAFSEEGDQLDLFVCIYEGSDELVSIPDSETKTAAEQCSRFLTNCVNGKLLSTMDKSSEAFDLAFTIKEGYEKLDQIRIYVLTDRQSKAKRFKSREEKGKTIMLEVIDIERLYRHWSEGKPRDELVINFSEVSGGALPCVYVPGEMTDYDYALTVIPGEALRFLYEKYGARLLEANVRSFLSTTGKVNKGIRDTLRNDPERFMAYNNGIVIVADAAHLGKTIDGGPGILWLKGMQIVNGGQTTASIYFSKKRDSGINLSRVRVPAKIIILRSSDATLEEALISDISRYANSQNSVKQSDLSANKPFHVEIEKLSLSTYCPDGIGRWFYERASGSYSTMLVREGTTPARLRDLKAAIPSSRKITKTDLAKFLNTWDSKPHIVSLGSQKNFERFMQASTEEQQELGQVLPQAIDVSTYKAMIAKTIVFKKTQSIVRPMFPAFQGNIVIYLISLLSFRLGNKIDFDLIWNKQDISPELRNQLQIWAKEINVVLHSSSGGRMISEWAKKQECWEIVKNSDYSETIYNIPELL